MSSIDFTGLQRDAADGFRAIYADAYDEDRAAMINNYWQQLWRASLGAGLTTAHPYMKFLNGEMGAWDSWYSRFKKNISRAFIPDFLSDWSEDLDMWADRWVEAYDKGRKAAKDLETVLKTKGVDKRAIASEPGFTEQFSKGAGDAVEGAGKAFKDATDSVLFWPIAGVVVTLVGLVWVSRR